MTKNKYIKKVSYARVGLLGNPSDHYGGKCLSFTFDKKAEVTIEDDDKLEIDGKNHKSFNLIYDGSNDLIKAVIKNLKLQNKNFKLSYNSEIPFGAGLAGSSAISVASIKALNEYFKLNLNDFEIAERSLYIETDQLKISTGFQDGYTVTFGGVLLMDFKGKEYIRKYPDNPYGIVKKIPVESIPYFLCFSGDSKKSSGTVHNSIREKFLNGSQEEKQQIRYYMDSIANFAEEGALALTCKQWQKLGSLMNENKRLRDQIYQTSKKDNEVINVANSTGALGAKLTGSGGTIVILTDETDSKNIFLKMSKIYNCYKPRIITGLA